MILTKKTRFFISCRHYETKLQPGDELILTPRKIPRNLLLFRRVSGGGQEIMSIRSEDGAMPLMTSKEPFSEREARFIAIALAASSGLSIEERNYGTIVFRFV